MGIKLIDSDAWIGFYQRYSSNDVLSLQAMPKITRFHKELFEIISRTFGDVLKSCNLTDSCVESSSCTAICKQNLGQSDFQMTAHVKHSAKQSMDQLKIWLSSKDRPDGNLTFSTSRIGGEFLIDYSVDSRELHPNNTVIFIGEKIFQARRPQSAGPWKTTGHNKNNFQSSMGAIAYNYQMVDPCKTCVLDHFKNLLADYRRSLEFTQQSEIKRRVVQKDEM